MANTQLRVVIFQRALPAYRVPIFQILAKRLRGGLHVVHGTASSLGAAASVDGFSCSTTRYTENAFFGLSSLAAHTNEVLKGRFDVAVLAWEARCVTLPVAMIRCAYAGIPIVLWGQGFSKTSTAHLGPILRSAIAMPATALVVYDETTAENLARLGKPVFVANNTIDVPSQSRAWARERRSLRLSNKLFASTEDALSILVCTRLQARNRLDLLADAIKIYTTRQGRVRLTLVGQDLLPTGIDSLKHRFGTAEVEVLGPIFDERELARLYAETDVAIVPDAVGLSILQAFAYGVPFVTASGAGPHGPEYLALQHGSNGLTYIRNDPASLFEALKTASLLSFLLSAGIQAAETYDKHYTPDIMVDGLMKAILFAQEKQSNK